MLTSHWSIFFVFHVQLVEKTTYHIWLTLTSWYRYFPSKKSWKNIWYAIKTLTNEHYSFSSRTRYFLQVFAFILFWNQNKLSYWNIANSETKVAKDALVIGATCRPNLNSTVLPSEKRSVTTVFFLHRFSIYIYWLQQHFYQFSMFLAYSFKEINVHI